MNYDKILSNKNVKKNIPLIYMEKRENFDMLLLFFNKNIINV